MLININLMLFLIPLTISIILGVSSKSILMLWIFMEINLMSFVPLMIFLNKKFNDSFMKYFLIQSLGSSLMLFFFMINYIKLIMTSMMFLIMMIFLKMGMFPFYMWYINLLNNLSWMNCLILMTMQKIMIFFILQNFIFTPTLMKNQIKNLIIIFILMNMIVSITLIFNTNLIKIIFGASSLNHVSWLMMIIMFNLKLWTFYFLIYTFTLSLMIYILLKFNLMNLKDLTKLPLSMKLIMISLTLMLIMTPPMLTFFLKIFTINIFMMNKLFSASFFMLIISIIYSYFYMKLLIPSSMIIKSNFMKLYYTPTPTLLLLSLSIFFTMFYFLITYE